MAIQKINLGTEPLGEGGDTYRSANTKINENFSNQAHAASRLVGTDVGNVMHVGAFGLGVRGNAGVSSVTFSGSTLTNKDIATTVYAHANTNGAGVYRDVEGAVGKAEAPIFFNAPILALKSADITTTLCAGFRPTDKDVVITSGNLAGNFYNEYRLWSSKNTTKDSKTNLLLASGSEVPMDSAASRLVGTGHGQIPLAQDTLKAAFQVPTTQDISGKLTTEDIDAFATGTTNLVATNLVSATGLIGNPYCLIFTFASYGSSQKIQLAFGNTNGSMAIRTKLNTWGVWGTFKSTLNTSVDSNGFLKGASPIVKVFADKVELNDDAVNQNVTFKKNGVGDYTITTVSGLSTDGWYIELPKDMNGNPKVAVTLTEVDGVISLKSYKRIFSMETFTFEPDLDNPLDIPDTRWIDLRLNDLPQEELNEPEPEEDPIVEEEVEPEVVEETSEESK